MGKNIQTSQEYLDSLKKQIEAMEPIDRVCATVLVQLGRIIAELSNRRDWESYKRERSILHGEEVKDNGLDMLIVYLIKRGFFDG